MRQPKLSETIWDSMNGGPTYRGEWHRLARLLETRIELLKKQRDEARYWARSAIELFEADDEEDQRQAESIVSKWDAEEIVEAHRARLEARE